MGGGFRRRRIRAATTMTLAALATLAGARAATAFDFFDGKLQVHGDVEEQIRGLGKDLSVENNIDLAQWYNVLNIQADVNWAPNGWGPFDVLHSYIRVEARYDCVWTQACGIFPSANAFGNDPERLPGYKTDGRRNGWDGSVYTGDINSGPILPSSPGLAKYTGIRLEPVFDPRIPVTLQPGLVNNKPGYLPTNDRVPARIDQLPGFVGLFAISGPNGVFSASGPPSGDDPAYFYFDDQRNCRFGVRQTNGGENGNGYQIIGPIDPRCRVEPIGALRFKPNPFNPMDKSLITGAGGRAELPGRPASQIPTIDPAGRYQSQGVYYPTEALRKVADKLGETDQNFSEQQLAWNHGGSQQETYELKEAYMDMEFFDSRLWVRAGKQNIVWGKTELFRTTDQFNPQDLALASLPSLEESRIALNAVRAVWSFYDVGPADDVRLEVAAILNKYQPNDIGRCGEPFTALVACNKTLALWAHGLTGFALAGEERPPDPWESIKGLQSGARLEFRLGRFSFQVSDFWGYDQLPYVQRIDTFERNVDPTTGLPRKMGMYGPCVVGNEPSCLNVQSGISADGATFSLIKSNQQNVRNNSPMNQQLFAMICATSIGFNSLDTTACGQTIFNSLNNPLNNTTFDRDTIKPLGQLTISGFLANSLAGNTSAASIIAFLAGAPPPFVKLNVDPCDGFISNHRGGCTSTPDFGPFGPPNFAANPYGTTPQLNQVLTDEQEALLGCGHFWGTDCEVDGIDLSNAEASVLLQSFTGIEGNYANPAHQLTTFGPQPGTTGFQQARPGGRYVSGTGLVQIPGARGPGDPGYNPLVDGCTGPAPGACAGAHLLVVPAAYGATAGQRYKSEMAALSHNFEVLVAALSQAPDTGGSPAPNAPVDRNEFDFQHPFSTATGQCSWAQPQFCSSQQAILTVSGTQRNTVQAGGSNGFGRRDFVWASGGEGVLKYAKRNVFGISADFAEDVTKSNWGIESAWVTGNRYQNNDEFSGISTSDTFNVTISVDRPTFINFLNQNRTFFFNSQWFFQYISGFNKGFTDNGPYNVLGTFTIQTGYFQDRLLPNVTFVYDVKSNSGAALPGIVYRFTENFSGELGINWFWGRQQYKDMPVNALGTVSNRVGDHAYQDAVENALAVVREREEIFMRLRYTF